MFHGFVVHWEMAATWAVLAAVVFAFPRLRTRYQTCPDGWPAGSLATTRLQALMRPLDCLPGADRDRYGRIVAICRVSEDLGAIIVREGLA